MGWLLMLVGILLLIGTFVKPSDMKTEAEAARQSKFLLHKWRWRGVAALLILIGIGLIPRTPSQQASQPTAAAPPAPSPLQTLQLDGKSPRGIRRSYDQVSAFPSGIFTEVTDAPPIDGNVRRVLTAADNRATLDLIGPRDDINKASLVLFMPPNDHTAIKGNLLVAHILLTNIFPGWEDRADWLNTAIKRISAGPSTKESLVRDGKLITVELLRELRTVAVEVSRSVE